MADTETIEAVQQPEVKPVDSATPPPEPAIAEDPKFSARLASLAKREAAFQARATQTKAEIAREQEALKGHQAEVQRLNGLREIARADPQRALAEALSLLGLRPDDIKGTLSEKGELDPAFRIRQLEAKLEEMERSTLESRKKELQAQQTAELQRFAARVTGHIEKNAEKYELTHLRKQAPLVLDVIKEAYKATGQIIDVDEACKVVEAHLEEEAKQILATKKISSQFAPVAPKEKDTDRAKTTPQEPGRTLTNDLGSQRPPLNLRDELVAIMNGHA